MATNKPRSMLPVARTEALPVIPLQDFEDSLDVLRRHISRRDDKRIVQQRAALRPHWDALDQRADKVCLASELASVIVAFPKHGGDPKHFPRVFSDSIAALKPTRYELSLAYRTMLLTEKYLTIAAVAEALKAARSIARSRRYLVTGKFDHPDVIAAYESEEAMDQVVGGFDHERYAAKPSNDWADARRKAQEVWLKNAIDDDEDD